MNTYDRIFGTGPRGLLISLALLAVAWHLESMAGLPSRELAVLRLMFFAGAD